ncbi:hypothetical protein [Guptibacillus hwajinpoensis]|uniref:Uncharacterized protein n=1 Tax=Guptibacillus hwajinpoensis TaxID=208199 RepID=A0ABU0K212_9BACL|nr:hypothetical protein [Alkalihalobacillus hemicentroti]MDQ0482453.1 hypothetical protein [Alkalihalobacillus hemicentroti]
MVFRNGVKLAPLHEKAPVVSTSNKKKEGVKVQQNLRNLIYDVYLILEGKEPLVYPDYSQALVKDYKAKLKSFEESDNKKKNELFEELATHLQEVIEMEDVQTSKEKTGTLVIAEDFLRLCFGKIVLKTRNTIKKCYKHL